MKITLDHLSPLRLLGLRNLGISITWKIHKVQKNIKAIKDGLKLRPGSKIIPFSSSVRPSARP